MNLQVILRDLSKEEYDKLWQHGTTFLLREDPRKGYSEKEKKEAARCSVISLVGAYLDGKTIDSRRNK